MSEVHSPQVEQEEQRSLMSRLVRPVAVVAVTGLAVAGGVYGYNRFTGDDASSADDTEFDGTVDTGEDCDNASIVRAEGNLEDWTQTGLVPMAEQPTEDNSAAVERINQLFGVGPLGHNIDNVSLAAFVAAITNPATDGDRIDPDYNVGEAFQNTLAVYRSNGGEDIAREDCTRTYQIMRQTGESTTDWARGETVTHLRAIRETDEDGNWRLVGMRVSELVIADDAPLSGVEFSLNSTSRETGDGTPIDGFAPALMADEGDVFLRGAPIETGTFTLDESDELAEAIDNQEGGSNRGGQGPDRGETDGDQNGTCGGRGCGTSTCGSCNPGGNPPGGNPTGGNPPGGNPNPPGGNPPGGNNPPGTTTTSIYHPPTTTTTTTIYIPPPPTTTTTVPPTHPPGTGPPSNL